MDRELQAALVDESPDALVALDADGRVTLWNRGAETVFDLPAASAVGRPLAALIDASAEGGIVAGELQRARAGAVVHAESMRRRSDGTLIHVNSTVRARRGDSNEVEAYFCAMSDITPLRVQRDAQLVHARYHGLLESAPDAIVVVNDIGRIVLFNAQARDMFGRDSADVIGEPIEVLLPARLRQAHVRHRNGFLGAPRMRPMGQGLELFGVRGNGEEFPVEISLSPIEGEGVRLVMSAIRDTTERRRIERALQEKNVELERASRAKDHFLATMSHELRTPLNAILGFTGLLLMQLPGPLNDAQRRQLEHVQASGKHLLSLINDLLDLAKIDSGRVELELEAVDCTVVVDEVVQTLRPAAAAKGLTIEWLAPGGPLLALADRRALHQVVLNLAGNAVKFTQQGGVQIEARALVVEGRRRIEIAVADTGVGISSEDQAQLFEAFRQLGDRRQRPQEGTGLGLHLSRRLAELMNGAIHVASEPGRGSRFALQLTAVAGG